MPLRMSRWDRARASMVGAVLLCSCGLVGFRFIERHVAHSQAAAEQRALQLVEAAVQAVGQQVERTLAAISTLHALGQAIGVAGEERSRSIAKVERHLREISADGRFAVLQVALIDQGGTLRWSTAPHFAPLDLSDREHFLVHRNGRTDPFVSAPLIGRVSGRKSIQLTRPVLTEDGRFDGVVVVSVDPVELSERLGEMPISSQGAVTLIRDDGIVLARTEDPDRFIGQQTTPEQIARLQAAIETSATDVAALVMEGLRGRELFVGVRSISGWPLMVGYAIEREPILAANEQLRRSHQLRLIAGLGLLLVLLVAADAMLARRRARQDAAQADAARREVVDILDALPGAAYRADLDGNGRLLRLELSAGTARLAGTTPERAGAGETGMPGPAERLAFLQRVLADGEALTEYRVEATEGGTRWLRDQGRLARRGEAGGGRIVGILTDVTAERALKAQALSAAKLATLGEMATGIAHEFNQPCAAISLAADVASVELLQKGPAALPRALAILDDIAAQTGRLRDVLDHFRIFARSDDGTAEAISVEQAVNGALAITRGSLVAAGVRVEVDLAPGLPAVSGRLVPLEQVIVNILINSRDAMEQIAPEFRLVRVHGSQDPGDHRVRIAVRDFGTGVAAEHLDRVFEPFFTTKPPGRGTGLGLAIAYATVASFQGEIAVENRLDGGAEVSMRLHPALPAPSERQLDNRLRMSPI